MDSLKPFDPNDIDASLTRVVAHGGHRYLMFPHIDATGAMPRFNSISCVIDGASPTIEDFSALAALVRQAQENAKWLISFNTPWLMPLSEAADIEQRAWQGRSKRK
jgi:hypothetical protein